MSQANLSDRVKTVRLRPDGSGYTVAAGSAAVSSDIIDTAGYRGVRFVEGFGAIVSGAATSLKVQQNTVNSGTGMADLAGSSITVADDDDNQIAVTDILHPTERYLRVVTSRATQNATIDFLIAELYDPYELPADTSDAIVVATEKHISPTEGTA
jgi:hypothetical protein